MGVSRSNANEATAERVRSPTITLIGGPAACSRAATLRQSPAAKASPDMGSMTGRTRASPVLTPTRTSMLSPDDRTSSTISAAAVTARKGSSSWERETPNRPTTASPMNFSTTPPASSILRRASVKNRSSSDCRSSGSSRSPRLVDPTRSQKSPVMTLRSASRPRADLRSAPHSLQNFESSKRAVPQLEQRITGDCPGFGWLLICADSSSLGGRSPCRQRMPVPRAVATLNCRRAVPTGQTPPHTAQLEDRDGSDACCHDQGQAYNPTESLFSSTTGKDGTSLVQPD
jgi:hypothetical protein